MATMEEIKWVNELVKSEMFYKGSTAKTAIDNVFADFDGSQPADLKEKVIKHTRFRLKVTLQSATKRLVIATNDGEWDKVKSLNKQIEFHTDCLIELD